MGTVFVKFLVKNRLKSKRIEINYKRTGIGIRTS